MERRNFSLLVQVTAAALLLAIAVLLSLWLSRYSAPAPPELNVAEMLLGAAALSLFSLSLPIALLGVFGWRDLRTRIDESVQAKLRNALDELREQISTSHKNSSAEIAIALGLCYGRLARPNPGEPLEVADTLLFRKAIDHTKRGLQNLQDNIELASIAKNNLAFYYALQGDPAHGFIARDLALELRNDGRVEDPNVLNTYAKVVATYSSYFNDPPAQLRETRALLCAVALREDVRILDKENAQRHLDVIAELIDRSVTTGNELA